MSDLNPNCLTLVVNVFLEGFFKKVDFEKNQQATKKHAKLPSRQRVNSNRHQFLSHLPYRSSNFCLLFVLRFATISIKVHGSCKCRSLQSNYRLSILTLGRWQSKTLILSKNVHQKSVETEFSIAICRRR